MHLAAQALALGEGGHDLEAVAEDHAVGPVGVVLVELGLGVLGGQAVEVGEEIGETGLDVVVLCATGLLALLHQVVDEDLGMDAFLDVERRHVDDEIGPVLLVFAAPDQLRVQVAVAAFVGDAEGGLVFFLHEGLVFGAGKVFAGCIFVADRIDRLLFLLLRHLLSFPHLLCPTGSVMRAGDRGCRCG